MPFTGVMRTSSSLSPSIFLTMAARGSACFAAGAGVLLTGAAAAPLCASAVPPNDRTRQARNGRRYEFMERSCYGYRFDRARQAKFARPAERQSLSGTARRSSRKAGAGSAARVVRAVQLFHALTGNVRVDLRGRKVRVTQQHLHHAQVRAMIQQV